MSEDFSGGAVVSLDRYRAEIRRLNATTEAEMSYFERVERLKDRILEATGLSFVSNPEPLPELVDFGEDDGA